MEHPRPGSASYMGASAEYVDDAGGNPAGSRGSGSGGAFQRAPPRKSSKQRRRKEPKHSDTSPTTPPGAPPPAPDFRRSPGQPVQQHAAHGSYHARAGGVAVGHGGTLPVHAHQGSMRSQGAPMLAVPLGHQPDRSMPAVSAPLPMPVPVQQQNGQLTHTMQSPHPQMMPALMPQSPAQQQATATRMSPMHSGAPLYQSSHSYGLDCRESPQQVHACGQHLAYTPPRPQPGAMPLHGAEHDLGLPGHVPPMPPAQILAGQPAPAPVTTRPPSAHPPHLDPLAMPFSHSGSLPMHPVDRQYAGNPAMPVHYHMHCRPYQPQRQQQQQQPQHRLLQGRGDEHHVEEQRADGVSEVNMRLAQPLLPFELGKPTVPTQTAASIPPAPDSARRSSAQHCDPLPTSNRWPDTPTRNVFDRGEWHGIQHRTTPLQSSAPRELQLHLQQQFREASMPTSSHTPDSFGHSMQIGQGDDRTTLTNGVTPQPDTPLPPGKQLAHQSPSQPTPKRADCRTTSAHPSPSPVPTPAAQLALRHHGHHVPALFTHDAADGSSGDEGAGTRHQRRRAARPLPLLQADDTFPAAAERSHSQVSERDVQQHDPYRAHGLYQSTPVNQPSSGGGWEDDRSSSRQPTASSLARASPQPNGAEKVEGALTTPTSAPRGRPPASYPPGSHRSPAPARQQQQEAEPARQLQQTPPQQRRHPTDHPPDVRADKRPSVLDCPPGSYWKATSVMPVRTAPHSAAEVLSFVTTGQMLRVPDSSDGIVREERAVWVRAQDGWVQLLNTESMRPISPPSSAAARRPPPRPGTQQPAPSTGRPPRPLPQSQPLPESCPADLPAARERMQEYESRPDGLVQLRRLVLHWCQEQSSPAVVGGVCSEMADVVRRRSSGAARAVEVTLWQRAAACLQPDHAQHWIDLARAEDEQGNRTAARDALLDGLEHCQQNAQLINRILKYLDVNVKDRRKAATLGRSILGRLSTETSEKNLSTIVDGAVWESQRGNSEGAAETMRLLLKTAQKQGQVYVEAVKMEERSGRDEFACLVAADAVRGTCAKFGPLWLVGLKLRERVQWQKVWNKWRTSSRESHTDPGDLLHAFVAQAQERASPVESLYSLASLHSRSHRVRRVVDLQPVRDYVAEARRKLTREMQWRLEYEAGMIEQRAGNLSDARAHLTQALLHTVKSPNLAWKVMLGCARLELAADRPEHAETFIVGALNVQWTEKARSVILAEYAHLCEYLGRSDEAVHTLRYAQSLCPQDWKLYLEESAVLLRGGRKDSAQLALGAVTRGLEQQRGVGRLWAAAIQLSAEVGDPIETFYRALDEVPRAGEVWCEGARLCMNPVGRHFNLHLAHIFLTFAMRFTPQYGDAFIERVRFELLVHGNCPGRMRRLQHAILSAEPNYGAVWLYCKQPGLVNCMQVLQFATVLIQSELQLHAAWYHRAMEGSGLGGKRRQACRTPVVGDTRRGRRSRHAARWPKRAAESASGSVSSPSPACSSPGHVVFPAGDEAAAESAGGRQHGEGSGGTSSGHPSWAFLTALSSHSYVSHFLDQSMPNHLRQRIIFGGEAIT